MESWPGPRAQAGSPSHTTDPGINREAQGSVRPAGTACRHGVGDSVLWQTLCVASPVRLAGSTGRSPHPSLSARD